jgi:hypothetical protein
MWGETEAQREGDFRDNSNTIEIFNDKIVQYSISSSTIRLFQHYLRAHKPPNSPNIFSVLILLNFQ